MSTYTTARASFISAIVSSNKTAAIVRAKYAELVAALPGGKYASKAEYTVERKFIIDGATADGVSEAYARKLLTVEGFTTLNPEHKVRGTKGGRKSAKGKGKGKTRKASQPERLTADETALLNAWRGRDWPTIRLMVEAAVKANSNRSKGIA